MLPLSSLVRVYTNQQKTGCCKLPDPNSGALVRMLPLSPLVRVYTNQQKRGVANCRTRFRCVSENAPTFPLGSCIHEPTKRSASYRKTRCVNTRTGGCSCSHRPWFVYTRTNKAECLISQDAVLCIIHAPGAMLMLPLSPWFVYTRTNKTECPISQDTHRQKSSANLIRFPIFASLLHL